MGDAEDVLSVLYRKLAISQIWYLVAQESRFKELAQELEIPYGLVILAVGIFTANPNIKLDSFLSAILKAMGEVQEFVYALVGVSNFRVK